MDAAGVILLGLGPGDPRLLTREAWDVIGNCTEIWLRTSLHPAVEALPGNIHLRSFDELYDACESFEALYQQIVDEVIQEAKKPGGIVYATPGHPFVAETTGIEIARRARQEKIPLRVIDGMSFLEPVLTALELDIFPHTVMVDALELAIAFMPLFPPDIPAIVSQLYSRQVASDVKLTLMNNYPDEHPVILVHRAGTDEQLIENLPLYQIDRSPHIGLLTSLFLPPLEPTTSFEGFQDVIAHLRSPEGCPWDREQDHRSLRADLLEEAYEVVDAIDADDPQSLGEELGDLLLLIVMHTQIAAEFGEFRMPDVISGIHQKIVSRHPHVFADLELDASEDVLLNWERMKADERIAAGKPDASILGGVTRSLPALIQADEYQQRAARVGFDWPEITGVWEKLFEELDEVKRADDPVSQNNELGDLLFAIVNLARWLKVEPESALREANLRFRKRFARIEAAARQQSRELTDLSLDEMESIWQESKEI